MLRRWLLKALIVGHRWLGTLLCLLFALWFASGIVLMYWGYPGVDAADRLAHAAPIDRGKIQLDPIDAWAQVEDAALPERAELVTVLDRPAYVFTIDGARIIVYADDGTVVRTVSADLARALAADWVHQPAAAASFEGELRLPHVDEWTVGGPGYAYWPLFAFSWPDGQRVYVSSTTGEVVQHTTRAKRLAAYAGAIPHWLYFTPLRRDGRLWQRLVLWSSATGLVTTLLGLAVGLWMYSPRRRYRGTGGERRSFPSSGQKRWHSILGLVFGLCASTWGLSGFLSMGSIAALNEPSAIADDVARALRGGTLDLRAFAAKSPLSGLQEVAGDLAVKHVEFSLFGGEPLYLAAESPHESRLIPVNFKADTFFDPEIVALLISQAIDPVKVAEAGLIHEYDAYYLDRSGELPLPVLRLRLTDPQSSLLYVDVRTARIVASYSRAGRWNRWLYHGLHSLDLPWLYRYRPLWDILMLVLLGGGVALSVTAVVIGGQVLARTFARSQPRD